MKNIIQDKLGRFKSLKINLLDGQRRGEIVFRRVFLIVVLYIILVLVGKQVAYKNEVRDAQAKETIEWINGDRVTTKPSGEVEVVPKEVFEDKTDDRVVKIEKFFRINRGNAPLMAHAVKFVEVADKYGLDYRLLPAIATMESGGGKSLFRSYNAWGYGKYNFSSFDEGIETVGAGLKKYKDRGLVTPGQIAPVYCPPNATNWAKGVEQFMNEIEAL